MPFHYIVPSPSTTLSPGLVGLSVTYAMSITHTLNFLVRTATGGFQLLDLIITELKSHMTC